MTGNHLEQFIETVDPDGCQVIQLPQRIWVFGGPYLGNVDPASLRESFLTLTLRRPDLSWTGALDKPENYPDWWKFSGYNNLLDFERDACYLARGTILFAESPGAYVELGALAIDPILARRLLVVIQAQHLTSGARGSFINLGPLTIVDEYGGKCVIGSASTLTNVDFDTIAVTVEEWLPKLTHRAKLSTSNPTHRLLMIADLVDIFQVSQISEILQLIGHFRIPISQEELGRSLKLLEMFDLVRSEQRGRVVFWTRNPKSRAPWVDYTGRRDHKFDRVRFKMGSKEELLKDGLKKSILEIRT